jgi:hypothetical protein
MLLLFLNDNVHYPVDGNDPYELIPQFQQTEVNAPPAEAGGLE